MINMVYSEDMKRVEDYLYSKGIEFLKRYRGLREPHEEDIFERIVYIPPTRIYVVNHLKNRPVASFNPGAILENRKLKIFPRLVFDYYWYVSSIGVFELDIEDILSRYRGGVYGENICTRIVVYPTNEFENGRGCEDPRAIVVGDEYWLLYTAVKAGDPSTSYPLTSMQGFAVLDRNMYLKRKTVFRVRIGDRAIYAYAKDSAFISIDGSRAIVVTRPMVRDLQICWRATVDVNEGIADIDSLEPVLATEEWEWKVGWSTNAIEIGSNEYLIGWHGVPNKDLSYRNGFAVLDREGRVLGITDYLLVPRTQFELYGDRPYVVFGCGLVKYSELLIWIGGVADTAIAIFATEINKVLDRIRWIEKK